MDMDALYRVLVVDNSRVREAVERFLSTPHELKRFAETLAFHSGWGAGRSDRINLNQVRAYDFLLAAGVVKATHKDTVLPLEVEATHIGGGGTHRSFTIEIDEAKQAELKTLMGTQRSR